MIPVGGGGLLSGCIFGAEKGVPVFAAEPSGADDCANSKEAGEIRGGSEPVGTICDAVRISPVGKRSFCAIERDGI